MIYIWLLRHTRCNWEHNGLENKYSFKRIVVGLFTLTLLQYLLSMDNTTVCTVYQPYKLPADIIKLLIIFFIINNIFCVILNIYNVVPLLAGRYKFIQIIGEGQSSVLIAAEVRKQTTFLN